MEHRTLEQLHDVAALYPDEPRPAKAMSKRERMERWAALLEQDPARRLSTLAGTEYVPATCREGLHGVDTPISIAYQDPVLRAAGLKAPTYGEARRFFGLSHGQLHYVVCECFSGSTIRSGTAAWRVRQVTPGFLARAWQRLTGR